MNTEWIIDRHRLRELLQQHPNWSSYRLAQELNRSQKWVRKWRRRISETPSDAMLVGQSRARHTPVQRTCLVVERRIVELRRSLAQQLGRVPGQRTILYYLHQDENLKKSGLFLPTSESTIWRILNQYQCFHRFTRPRRQPIERPEPMSVWEIDFSDLPGVASVTSNKQVHIVETFNVVDRGTSILVDTQVSDSYDAEHALIAMAGTLIVYGCPLRIVFDRDPRLVGSWTGDGFPSAFMRFLLSVGIHTEVCPPQRPDLKPCVERFQRTLEHEWIRIEQPPDLAAAKALLQIKHDFYNRERPNQSTVCSNQPPYEAFPTLPILPHIPDEVDPDQWLVAYHNRLLKRRVTSNGSVQIGKHRYYVDRKLAGQQIIIQINGHERQLDVYHRGCYLKSKAIKNLYHGTIPFGDYLRLICQEARAEWRQIQRRKRVVA